MKQKYNTTVIIILLFLFSTILIFTRSNTPIAFAQGGDITGVDVVFVVDQSGSMGGAAYGSEIHPIPNDPHDLRFTGLQQMVQRLASYRMFYFANSPVRFNIAVVYFGQTAPVIVEPTIIDPDNPDEWEALGKRLQEQLTSEKFKKNLGMTDHLLGLKQAKKLLQTMEQEWPDGESHQQAIFILTDGEWALPCPQPDANNNTPEPPYCKNGKFQSNTYAQMMDEYITSELPYPRYRLYVGGINARSGEWWSYVRKWWEKWTHGHAELLNSNTMWTFFEEVLAELTVNNEALASKKTTSGFFQDVSDLDRIPINPYLQEVVFIIHKAKPEQRVKIYQDDGQPVDNLATTTIVDADNYIERISIKYPQPGYMTIERPSDSEYMRTYMLQLNANVNCNYLDVIPQYIPQLIQCEITANNGEALPPYDDPQYQLSVEARIGSDNGSMIRLPLTPTSPGVYSSYWLPNETGQYGLTILGSTKSPEGKPITFFGWPLDGNPLPVSVVETHARLETASQVLALQPTDSTIVLVDKAGNPVKMPAEIDDFVHIRLEATSSQEDVFIDLIPGEDGYRGSLTLTYPDTYSLHLYGKVEDPSSKKIVSDFSQSMDDLEVIPPEITWEGFSSPWPQYRSGPVAYSLRDADGELWAQSIAPIWTLGTEARAQGAEGDKQIPVDVAGPGQWRGEFAPKKSGESQIVVSVWAKDAQGRQVDLWEQKIVLPFMVEPMTLVKMIVQSPEGDTSVPWRDIFWRTTPLQIIAVIVDEKGDLLPPDEVQEKGGAKPFEVSVISPEGEISGPLSMRAGDKSGRYEIIYNNFPEHPWYTHKNLGWYEIRLHPVAKLKNTYVMESDEDTVVRVELTRHPLWWVLPLVVGFAMLFLMLWTLYNAYLRAWVAQGEIVTAEGRRLTRLSNAGKHTVIIKGGLPMGVKKVKVHQPLGKSKVKMTVWKLNKKGKTIKVGPRFTSSLAGIRHEMGSSRPPQLGFSFPMMIFGLLSLLFLAGLIGVLYAVITSLN